MASRTNTKTPEAVIIKKYANRRLYNTQTSMYITLDDVRKMVKEGTEVIVRDAKTDEDLTRQILTQIIFEQEINGANNVFPVAFLKRVIEMYDDSISELIPHYLETSMEAFAMNQEKIRSYMGNTWDQYNPMSQFEELGRQNMNMFTKAFSMFNPFEMYFNQGEEGAEGTAAPSAKKKKK